MKNRIYYIFRFIFILLVCQQLSAQNTYTTNTNPIGLEYNLLFKANTNYSITQSGSAQYSNNKGLFDGKLYPLYTSIAPTYEDPYVVLIEGLPSVHTQTGGWIGWTTRYWGASKFKIEGYNSYSPSGIGWKTLVDYSTTNYSGNNYMTPINLKGTYTKLRYTFYEATGRNGRLGLSELVFLHPEATSPYENLIESSSIWSENNFGISYDGNVGIGTANPSMKLHLENVGDFDGIQLESLFKIRKSSAGSNHIVMEKLASSGNLYLRSRPAGDYSGNLILNDAGGNVGIGTASPSKTLEVNGDANVKGDFQISDYSPRIFLKRNTDNGGYIQGIQTQLNDGTNNFYFGNLHSEQWIITKGKFDGQRLFTVKSNGNVGIGTNDPNGWKLSVNGNIRAKEIKVETDWSDFVFEEDYNLPTLQEVERHIEVNGHLQDIPSAKEVAENGIFLGEMDSKLLQKIEELMLYTIKQNKEILELKKKLIIIENRLDEN